MKPITDFFNRPEFARVNSHISSKDSGKCDTHESHTSSARSSSPVTVPPSSLSESLPASQRLFKGGKEIVISSDGEDTESVSSLDDPDTLFAPKPKQPQNVREAKGFQSNKALLDQLSAPKRYKNTIDSLVHAAVDDHEIEANVAKARATLSAPPSGQSTPGPRGLGAPKGFHESMLTSALGDDDEQEGTGLRRLLDAVRRTEAFDQDRAWRFFAQTPKTPPVLEFPVHLFPPTSHLAILREPNSRKRAFQSGILEFAASVQRLPDELIRWLFQSIPAEPKEELRLAYRRVFTQVPANQVESLVRPSDVDNIFRYLGVNPQALDISGIIAEDRSEQASRDTPSESRAALLSVLDLLHNAAELFSNEVRERAVHILLRITLDTTLTTDCKIRSALQSALSALLESVKYTNVHEMEYRICRTVYETVKDAQFQSRMLQHILPTSTWISRLRYRLAAAFLLQSSSPLTESMEMLLDLDRLTAFLLRDKRFHLKSYKMEENYDYAELQAIAFLLEIVINSCLHDLGLTQGCTEQGFNAAIDRLAAQLKKVFSSIEDTGASHLKRMLAKEALEALHYRVLYSVRSRPPPRKTLFKTFATEDGNIRSMFNARIAINTSDGEGTVFGKDAGETAMPIRETIHPS